MKSNNIFPILFSLRQVLLLLVKRLASLHYNSHQDTFKENKNTPKAFRAPSQQTKKSIEENNSIKDSCSYQPVRDCEQLRRDDNRNCNSTKHEEDYDEVDFLPVAENDYQQGRRIDATANKSTRIEEENMGSNVSTSGGGKGLSGRRTQSSSEFTLFVSIFFDAVARAPGWIKGVLVNEIEFALSRVVPDVTRICGTIWSEFIHSMEKREGC